MIRKLFFISLFPVVFAVAAISQEVVVGLQSNYIITQHKPELNKNVGAKSSGSLELPFFDDFSYSSRSIIPDSKKWSDNYVFINDTYSDKQPTVGVATFDAIDNTGKLYATANNTGFAADTLTSQPINLNYAPADNIVLSFYYQAGGLGDFPDPNDSLTLQFFAPDENRWFSVWRAHNLPDDSFRQAALSITDERFLKNGFRFRFINYASLNRSPDLSMIGNCDHWNIDYVLLDKNRNVTDIVHRDVAFRRGIRSVLKTYESMPWNHFQRIQFQEMGAILPIQLRNNDAIIRNATRGFNIFDVHRNVMVRNESAGAVNIAPQTNVDYDLNLIYTFNSPSATDSARFRITSFLINNDYFDPKENDTVVYYQVFKNYFAFDDGTAEMGYGISGQGSRNAMAAMRFNAYIPDTLRSIMICFNDSYQNSNRRSFDLVVWNDNNGIPGNVIYERNEVMVETGNKINGFYNYAILDEVPVSGTFYVGWRQRTETFLNAGLDINTQHKGRQFFWINGEWRQSEVNGSLMIRPVVGKPDITTSVPPENRYTPPEEVIIYPNPATDFITVTTKTAESVWITITDLSGRELIRTQNSGEQIDISSLAPGVYIVSYSVKGKYLGHNRLIKVR